MASLRSCCLTTGAPTSAPATFLLPATPMVTSGVKDPELRKLGEIVPDALPPASANDSMVNLAAAALMAQRRSHPSIGGRRVGCSPLPKPAPLAPTSPNLSACSTTRTIAGMMARLIPKMTPAAPSATAPSATPWPVSWVSADDAPS
jgi:hypothetical protein